MLHSRLTWGVLDPLMTCCKHTSSVLSISSNFPTKLLKNSNQLFNLKMRLMHYAGTTFRNLEIRIWPWHFLRYHIDFHNRAIVVRTMVVQNHRKSPTLQHCDRVKKVIKMPNMINSNTVKQCNQTCQFQ